MENDSSASVYGSIIFVVLPTVIVCNGTRNGEIGLVGTAEVSAERSSKPLEDTSAVDRSIVATGSEPGGFGCMK